MKWLTQWAITSSALILIVLAARYFFRNKLSARLRYALWAVVLVRLLAPFQIELPAAVSAPLPVLASNLAPELPSKLERPLSPDTAATDTRIPEEYFMVEPYFSHTVADLLVFDSEDGYVHLYQGGFTLGDTVVALWLAGAGLAGAAMLWSNLRFFIRLRRRRRPMECPDSPVRVYTAEGLPSPCLFGVFRPAVYVTPEAAENPDTLRHVLAHELTHYAHKDHIWSLLRILALALHWYNPLVWLAVVLSKRDGELACDEGAVARLGEAERIPYGRTLVDMVAKRSLRPRDLLSCSTAMTGGGKSIQQRVAQLVKKRSTVKTALFAAVAVVVLAVVFVFAGRQSSPDLDRFYAELKRATAIQLYSSDSGQSNLVPITDGYLLFLTRRDLSGFIPSQPKEPGQGYRNLENASRIVLSNGGEETTYTLLFSGSRTILFQGDASLALAEGETLQEIGYTKERTDMVSFIAAYSNLQHERTYGELPALSRFRSQVDSAVSIRYSPPTYSSQFYPYSITNADLLAEAKGRLSGFVPCAAETPDLDWKALMDASRIDLSDGEKEVSYSLLMWGGRTLLFQENLVDIFLEQGEVEIPQPFAYTSDRTDTASFLASCALRQTRQTDSDTGSPTLEQFQFQVDSAVSIRYCPPLHFSTIYPEPITDPELLALARNSLSGFEPLPEEVLSPNEQTLMAAHRVVLSDGTEEVTYAFVQGSDGRTYLYLGEDVDASLGSETETPAAIARKNSAVDGPISSYARMQQERTLDPSFPVPMTPEALSQYTPYDIYRARGYRLQGWEGDLKDAEFDRGYTSLTRILLRYSGDETHSGGWILELLPPALSASSTGITVVSDRPEDVFVAEQYAGQLEGDALFYDMMGPAMCAARLQPEDVTDIQLPQRDTVLGPASPDLETLKNQMLQSLYHQFSAEYDERKYGQYTLTLQWEGKRDSYRGHELAGDANQLNLSIGTEKDVVCLWKTAFAVNNAPHYTFVRSPELYRAMLELHGNRIPLGTVTLQAPFTQPHGQIGAEHWNFDIVPDPGAVDTQ